MSLKNSSELGASRSRTRPRIGVTLLLSFLLAITGVVAMPAADAASRLARPTVTTTLSNGNNVGFSWNAISSATKYDYRIIENGVQTYRRNNVSGRAYNRGLKSTTTEVCVKVRAKGSGYTSSYWGTSCQEVLPAPQVTSRTVANERVTVRWNAVNGASQYFITARLDGQQYATSVRSASTRSTSMYFGVRTGRICVTVAARNSSGLAGRTTWRCHNENPDIKVRRFTMVPSDRQAEYSASGSQGTVERHLQQQSG